MVQVRLEEVNAENFGSVRCLSVNDIQKEYLNDDPIFYIAESKFHPNRIPMLIVDDNIFRMDSIVGFFVYGLTGVEEAGEEQYRIAGFMIHKRYQRKGYGKKAMKLLLKEIKKDKRHNRISLCVHEKNEAAIALYKSFGFEYCGHAYFIIDEETGIETNYFNMELLY
jgi:diamine N-acetyltransferase